MRLCSALALKLVEADKDRKYKRRGAEVHKFEGAVGAILADLFKATEQDRQRWSYRTMTASAFTDDWVSSRHFQSFRAAALSLELIETLPGHYARIEFQPGVTSGSGKTSRFRPTEALFAFAAQWNITPENIDEHFKQHDPDYGIVLREGSRQVGGDKIKGRAIKIKKTDQTEQTEQLTLDVSDLNSFLRKHKIVGGTHKGYQRIFNQGNVDGYRWNKGGRLYSVGDKNYQTLKKEQRLRMTIDGQGVVEIDIRASYLTILHGIRKATFDPSKDPYAIPGVERSVVKAWVTMTLGHTHFHTRWPPKVNAEFRSKGIELGKRYPLKELQPTVLHHLPVMASWPEQTYTVFDLMFRESQAMIATMLQLQRNYTVPSLCVHDSIIVPSSAQNLAERVLREQFKEVCGITPTLDTH